MRPDEGQIATLNGLTGMAQGGPVPDAGQTRGQELEAEYTAAVAERNPARNVFRTRIGDYAGAYHPQQYQPYGRSIYEELGFVGRDEFKELENTIDRLRSENIELRQQVSSLQSMAVDLNGLVCEIRQILRFRYVD